MSDRKHSAAVRDCIRAFLPHLGGHGDHVLYLQQLESAALEFGRQGRADEIARNRPRILVFAAGQRHPEGGQ